MILKGKLVAQSPIYRGNARNTVFTRDGDGKHRLVSLAGEISGTAQALMDAFIGESKNKKNIGLLDRLWRRLYGTPLPGGLITDVSCELAKSSYPKDHFFDLRMGIKLDEDRWAAEANANYKMETVLRQSAFNFQMQINDKILKKEENEARLHYLIEELRAGRFWFGAGKSKGLGRLRLEGTNPIAPPSAPPPIQPGTNHLTLRFCFDAANPVLVGWNWGKVDPQTTAFADVEGRLLISAITGLPDTVRERLEMALGGPMLSPEDWKEKFKSFFPRILAIWLKERSAAGGGGENWVLTEAALKKLQKGKHGLSKKIVSQVKPLAEQPFASKAEAEAAFKQTLGKKANMAGRIVDAMESQEVEQQELDSQAWETLVRELGIDPAIQDAVVEKIDDEPALIALMAKGVQPVLPRIFDQVDQQIRLLRSDVWVDQEIENRKGHLQIKQMLANGQISDYEWGDPEQVPPDVNPELWREFVETHRQVQFRHMLNRRNLEKSMANDQTRIALLQSYRTRARQELSRPEQVDFRAGGPGNRLYSRKYGKPYDTVFMRMLSWAPSPQKEEAWEIYVPGATLKGAFRKRASQLLKTLWGESRQTDELLNRAFGAQGRMGRFLFSDAYLQSPEDPDRHWCSTDGVKMDPKTGQPVETAKRDYLYAYGQGLEFGFAIDITDISPADFQAFALLFHLLRDFENGDIPIGGEKTSGFGWVRGRMEKLDWRITEDSPGITSALFGDQQLDPEGIWQSVQLSGPEAKGALRPPESLGQSSADTRKPPKSRAGFISHRAFGGHCGTLIVEAEPLTPLHIKESGEPSFTAEIDGEPVNGWDFFTMAPPEARQRGSDRVYALPARSLRGCLRHLYAAGTDSRIHSQSIVDLTPVEQLFGWVGEGPNQALAARLSVGFGYFESPRLAWFKVPYPYGAWRFEAGEWKSSEGGSAVVTQVADTWRFFPHAPLAPPVQQQADFAPDTVQASYFRAILPGSKARFSLRFWNLTDEELNRLLWCINLEAGLAHKMGNHRYLGFGSLRFRVTAESFLIDWAARYSDSAPEPGKRPINAEKLADANTIRNYQQIRQVLDAGAL